MENENQLTMLSELIATLQAAMLNYGDVPVFLADSGSKNAMVPINSIRALKLTKVNPMSDEENHWEPFLLLSDFDVADALEDVDPTENYDYGE